MQATTIDDLFINLGAETDRPEYLSEDRLQVNDSAVKSVPKKRRGISLTQAETEAIYDEMKNPKRRTLDQIAKAFRRSVGCIKDAFRFVATARGETTTQPRRTNISGQNRGRVNKPRSAKRGRGSGRGGHRKSRGQEAEQSNGLVKKPAQRTFGGRRGRGKKARGRKQSAR